MTVTALNTSSGAYTGNGSTTVFPFTFSTGSASEVQVLVNGSVVTAGFAVAVSANQSTVPGGSVTFATAPVNGAIILITSNPSFQQLISFKDSGPFLQSTLDTALDRIARLLLYLRTTVSRAVVFPLGETVSALPSATARAGKFLGFDGSGQFVALPGTSGDPGLRSDLAATTGHTLIGGFSEAVNSVNIKDYGAKCDTSKLGVGGTDDTAAVQAAIDYLATRGGGRVLIPGHTRCASALNLDNLSNIEIIGSSGNGAGYNAPPPAQLIYTGAGSAPFISADHSNAITLRNLGVRYTSASYTGDLVAFRNLTSPSTADASYALVDRCLIGGIAVDGARSLVSLEGAIISTVRNSHMHWAQSGIRGAKEIALANVLYSNSITVTDNTFDNLRVTAIMNPGQTWRIDDNTFEGTSGTGSYLDGMPRAIWSDISLASGASCSISFCNNWLGDGVHVTDAWVSFNHLVVSGTICGNSSSTGSTSVPDIKLITTSIGLDISGNGIGSFIDLGNVAHYALNIAANTMYTDVANIANACADIKILANKIATGLGFANSYIRTSKMPLGFRLGADFSYDGAGSYSAGAPSATDLSFLLNGNAGRNRQLAFTSDGTQRVRFGLDASNNLGLLTYTALGAFVGYALTITPATMATAFGGALTAPSLAVTGALTSSGGGIGYATGAGGTVTQATSRTTGVTINKLSGQITLFSAAGSATWATFTVTNSQVAATDVIRLNQASGTDKYMLHVTHVAAGSFDVTSATTGGTTTEQPVFNFAVVKAVAA